jgi:hypothetical protein
MTAYMDALIMRRSFQLPDGIELVAMVPVFLCCQMLLSLVIKASVGFGRVMHFNAPVQRVLVVAA